MTVARKALSVLLLGAGVAAWGWSDWRSFVFVTGVVGLFQSTWAVMCWCEGVQTSRLTWGPLTMAMWLLVHPFTKHARLVEEQAEREAPRGF